MSGSDVGLGLGLYTTKNMTSGEGGFVTTDEAAIAKTVRKLRQHGESERYHHDVVGYNFRMTDIAAAIGLAQLRKLRVLVSLTQLVLNGVQLLSQEKVALRL